MPRSSAGAGAQWATPAETTQTPPTATHDTSPAGSHRCEAEHTSG